MEYFQKDRKIKTNRILSELDKFVLEFIQILEKYADYVIISGYVSILLGRTRTTEDIDVFIKKISFEQFSELYQELEEKNFWCINAEDKKEIFNYLKDGLAVRFAKKNNSIPNFEVKFPKDKLDEMSFEDSIQVITKKGVLKISSLERHIAFKEFYLGSEKDIEDAKHIEELFKEKIDFNKINKIKELIKERKNKNEQH